MIKAVSRYIRKRIRILIEQSQIEWEQNQISQEQRAVSALCPTSSREFERRRAGLDHWIIGLNVRIGDLNEHIYGSRRGYGKDGSTRRYPNIGTWVS